MIADAVVERSVTCWPTGPFPSGRSPGGLGISRGTVNAISQGRRPDYSQLQTPEAANFPFPQGVPRRCPGCGGMVQMPCLLCHVRPSAGLTGRGESDRKADVFRPPGR